MLFIILFLKIYSLVPVVSEVLGSDGDKTVDVSVLFGATCGLALVVGLFCTLGGV